MNRVMAMLAAGASVLVISAAVAQTTGSGSSATAGSSSSRMNQDQSTVSESGAATTGSDMRGSSSTARKDRSGMGSSSSTARSGMTSGSSAGSDREYDRMVRSNQGYRSARMRTECGPIQAEDLRRQCMDSFGMTATNDRGMSGSQPGMMRSDRSSGAATSSGASGNAANAQGTAPPSTNRSMMGTGASPGTGRDTTGRTSTTR